MVDDGRARRLSARCIVLDVEHPAYMAAARAQIATRPTLPEIIHRAWSACYRTAEAPVLQPYRPGQILRSGSVANAR